MLAAAPSPATGISRYLRIQTLDAWRSGSACDSSDADIHKVIRSNRVAFIGLTTHGG
jgi:hypothetical protein